MSKRFLVIGEINVDVILSGLPALPELGREVVCDSVETVMGSASAIYACRMATLGQQVSFIGLVGDDAYGHLCVESLAAAGVDTGLVIVDPARHTGATFVMSLPENRAMVTHLGSIAELSARHLPPGLFLGFEHVHVTSPFLQVGLAPDLPRLAREARDHGLTVSFDPQWDPGETWTCVREMAPSCTVLMPSEEEACGMTGRAAAREALDALAGWGSELVVVKLGAGGAIAASGGRVVRQPGVPIKPVDTTGAGDTFDAAFVKRLIADGRSVEESLAYACAAGAAACMQVGGASEPLRHKDVMRVMRDGHV